MKQVSSRSLFFFAHTLPPPVHSRSLAVRLSVYLSACLCVCAFCVCKLVQCEELLFSIFQCHAHIKLKTYRKYDFCFINKIGKYTRKYSNSQCKLRQASKRSHRSVFFSFLSFCVYLFFFSTANSIRQLNSILCLCDYVAVTMIETKTLTTITKEKLPFPDCCFSHSRSLFVCVCLSASLSINLCT